MIDVVTVVFGKELDFLKIQAKSIDLYIDQYLISTIKVIVNDNIEKCSEIDTSWWGTHQDKVRIIHCNALFKIESELDGWDSQQLYKILACANSSSEYSCILDAKTWFIKKLTKELIFDNSGKANCTQYKLFSGFESARIPLSKLFNLNYDNIIAPGGVPFFFHNNTILEMITWVYEHKKENFADFFCTNVKYPNHITEFTLYSAFVQHKNNFDKLYSGITTYQVVNLADFETDNFEEVFKKMKNMLTLTCSIHRKAYSKISESQFSSWCNFLASKNLFPNEEKAKNQLNTFRTGVENGSGIRL
jgi:hypothetical protein